MNRQLLCFLLLVMMTVSAVSQSILGKWRTVDDKTGEEKSIVKIYENNGKVFGKIIEIFNPEKRNLVCKFCKGQDHNKPILGLNIIKNMEKEDDSYIGGTITDPQDGKTYRCRLKLHDKNTLQVRGYIAFFYSTQYWKRENE
ncbi:DUF2147 domain-containing protein [Yeosuana marina]|uniref:DUF2147 domain-containing protein n=1 Tax=Yeosuana marina TaxID=1565536 RepID=UPI00141F2D7C|nr:DUF2147 domain-containing protein [Yeosuana marina]